VENGLAGSLPSELSVMRSSLYELFLPNNTLTGNLPDSFSSLEALVELDVEGNGLSGNPWPQLLPLSNLARLRISSNDFAGTIPVAVADLDRLVELWVAENRFSGALPTQLGDLGNLQSLFLYDNDFSGRLPSELGNLRLFGFQAHNNQLTGAIPDEFYNNVNLIFLRLDNNRLSGPISGEFGRLVNLSDLWLQDNLFTGVLPFSFYGLNQLGKCNVRERERERHALFHSPLTRGVRQKMSYYETTPLRALSVILFQCGITLSSLTWPLTTLTGCYHLLCSMYRLFG
jgi:Leucine-rich repeat (LRR) protein